MFKRNKSVISWVLVVLGCVSPHYPRDKVLITNEVEKNLNWILHQLTVMNDQIAEVRLAQDSLAQQFQRLYSLQQPLSRTQNPAFPYTSSSKQLVPPNKGGNNPQGPDSLLNTVVSKMRGFWRSGNYPEVIFYYSRFASLLRFLQKRSDYRQVLEWTFRSYIRMGERETAQQEFENQKPYLNAEEIAFFQELFNEK